MAHELHLEVGRSLTPSDLHAIALLAERVAEIDGERPFSDRFARELMDPNPNGFLHVCVWDADELVGYAIVDDAAKGAAATAEIAVDERGRDARVGALLLDQAARETGEPVLLWAHGSDSATARLAAGGGFTKVRGLWRMKRTLGKDVAAFTAPDGIKIRPFERHRDEADWLELNARAFVDLPDQGQLTRAGLDDLLEQDWVDLDGFLLAHEVDGSGREGRLVGFHWTKTHPAQGPRQPRIGEVYVLGVDPDAHGRGLGKALTLAGLAYLWQQGIREVILYVEDTNQAAIATYERLGFTRYDTDVLYRASSA